MSLFNYKMIGSFITAVTSQYNIMESSLFRN